VWPADLKSAPLSRRNLSHTVVRRPAYSGGAYETAKQFVFIPASLL
jgi:hypothetical protein